MALHLRLARWTEEHPHASNALLVTGMLCGVSVISLFMIAGLDSGITFVCSIVVGLPLYLRARWPVTSALLVGAFALTMLAVVNVATIITCIWAVPWVVFTVASRSSKPARRVVLTAALVGSAAFGVLSNRWFLFLFEHPSPLEWAVAAVTFDVLSAAFVTVAFLVGDLARGRRLRREQLEDRARRLEIEREQEVRLAAQDERTRIAREMHDVVAHSLSVVIAQADGARYAASGSPQVAVEALGTIAETARGSLTEMRRLLGVLRTDNDAATKPVPQLADLPDLIASVRSAGLPVSLSQHGDAALGTGAQLTIYRVVQEGLTNVLKHAWQATAVRVVIDHRPDYSWVEITNDGVIAGEHARAPGAGQGLQGLRERVALYGGDLTAGPHATRPDVFVVRATVPVGTGERG